MEWVNSSLTMLRWGFWHIAFTKLWSTLQMCGFVIFDFTFATCLNGGKKRTLVWNAGRKDSGACLTKLKRKCEKKYSALSYCQSCDYRWIHSVFEKNMSVKCFRASPASHCCTLLTVDLWDCWHHTDRLAVLASHLFGPGLLCWAGHFSSNRTN